MNNKAIYPGSFDPVTNGHLDIIKRSVYLWDNIILAVLDNPKKKYLFSKNERIDIVKNVIKDENLVDKVEVDHFNGLLVDFARKKNANMIIRGLRAMSDFEFEFALALTNNHLEPKIETVFLMANVDYSFISSSIVKEVTKFGGDLSSKVPPYVFKKLREKFGLKN